MNTNGLIFIGFYFLISATFIGCGENQQKIQAPNLNAEFTKGVISITSAGDTTNWKSSFPSDTSLIICFEENSLAIIFNGESRILLPKQDKDCYSYSDILFEFESVDSKVMQDYFTYYLDAFKKKEKKDYEISAMVSRGPITMLYPDEFCPQWKDSITFSWKTNLDETDKIIFEILNDAGDGLFMDTIPAMPSDLKLSKEQAGLSNDADYSWRAYLSGTPPQEGMKFSIADSATIVSINLELQKASEIVKEYPDQLVNDFGFPTEAIDVCWGD